MEISIQGRYKTIIQIVITNYFNYLELTIGNTYKRQTVKTIDL